MVSRLVFLCCFFSLYSSLGNIEKSEYGDKLESTLADAHYLQNSLKTQRSARTSLRYMILSSNRTF